MNKSRLKICLQLSVGQAFVVHCMSIATCISTCLFDSGDSETLCHTALTCCWVNALRQLVM